jgi:hypothetical protein
VEASRVGTIAVVGNECRNVHFVENDVKFIFTMNDIDDWQEVQMGEYG